ncbi:MAG: carboxypeptidase regulatory-like domain-containing protein [Bacteroidales bacterium]|nr:carboxypeptidase regulatory-like domain-containing protein [Bacteroidales bacterium]
MIKKLTSAILAALLSAVLMAQAPTGGVKGTVVNRTDKTPVAGATLKLMSGATEIGTVTADAQGNFHLDALPDGMYDLVIDATGFLTSRVNVTVNDGYVKNMFNLSLSPVAVSSVVDDTSFGEFDLDGMGYEDTPTILVDQNDVFNNIAGYNFSSVRFKARGYASESQDVYLAGIKMNDALTGYSPYSLWSGLNEVTRSKTTSIGSEISEYGLGSYNGLQNIYATPSKVRPGTRFSILTNSALYRLRLMGTYAVPENDKGWSYAFSASARLGGNDWIQGVYYRSFAYYAGVEKNWGDVHRLALVSFAAPGVRGAQNASTQEVYDLMGDNMYNSNWGYQNGKVRNARNRITFEPITFLKYDYTPSQQFGISATLLWRTGKNGYTALDWYDAPDPRPDYYRNLPSYFYNENSDFNRLNPAKAAWARDAWENNIADVTHVNWDRLYEVNRNAGGRSKYALEERHVDQNDFNFGTVATWKPRINVTLKAGLNAKRNITEQYKVLNDLLGGDYFLNVDQFAERDYSSSNTMIQNDLDYFFAHGEAQKVKRGDKYGYDYNAHILKGEGWLSGKYTVGGFEAGLGGRIGKTVFWREGLMRKGLFPGLDGNGNPISYQGQVITTYDSEGQVITSKGNSLKADFLTYAAKLNLAYTFNGGHRVYANAGYSSESPLFNQAFIAPRTRNTMIKDLENVKSLSTDVNYMFANNGYRFRLTGFYTTIEDQTDVMSVYYDLNNSFGNFALRNIDQRHVGMELGFEVPTPLSGLSVVGAFTYGEYVYTSNPTMTATVDNSAEVVYEDLLVPYWKSNPVFRKNASGEYVRGADGTYEVDHYAKHYVPSTPQLATSIGLSYFYNYWFIDADLDYFDKSYLDMNPLYRIDETTAGADKVVTPAEVEYMASQEKFKSAWVLNFSVGKSWYYKRKYQYGFSLNAKNLLNAKDIKTGGFEQTRIVDNTVGKERYYRFDSKYFYMQGFNYMLNLYFRF